MLTIFCNNNYKTEREYICKVLLNEFLGIEYEIEFQARKDWLISDSNKDIKILLPDILFQTPPEDWLTERSLPNQPLPIWDISRYGIDCPVVNKKLPVIYGNIDNSSYRVPLDIFSSAFFMLTRYEEVVNINKNLHGRFPATASISFQEGFLDRPIINEYIEILWNLLKKCWQNLKRKKHFFRILPSHDVDIPFNLYFLKPSQLLRKLAADLFVRKKPQLSLQNFINYFKVKGDPSLDPHNNFDLIMDLSEKYNLKSSFYFMGGGRTRFDPLYYQLDHPAVIAIIKNIRDRDHEIGFHPSYASATRKDIWKQEYRNLSAVVPSNSIIGGRQHFLRTHVPDTWRYWDMNGLTYDSSLGYADHSGFRCGVCYEYTLFDLIKRKQLNIKERPLIVMDCSVIDKKYMNMGPTQKAFDYMNTLKSRCKIFNGDFTILWHNDRFQNKDEVQIYEQLISQ
jgi:hypothetical protein